MSLIGPKNVFPRTSLSPCKAQNIGKAEAQTLGPEPAHKADLVEINGGDSKSAFVHATKNAAGFVLKNAMPTLGALIAGPVGLTIGALATATVEYLDHPEKSTPARLKIALTQALKTGAFAGLLGLPGLVWAPLAPILQGAATSLGTGTAFALDFNEQKKHPDFSVNLPKLASRFEAKAQEKLKEAGHNHALDGLPSGFSLTSRARKLKAQMRLAQITAVTTQHLGAGTAVAILHEIGKNELASEKMNALVKQPFGKQPHSTEVVEGVSVQRLDGFMDRERTWGLALYDTVFLEASLPPTGQDAKTDFILGHELSHVKNKDSSSTLLEKAIEESLQRASGLLGSTSAREKLFDVQGKFDEAVLAQSRENEFRADKDGFDFAVSKGHEKNSVTSAAREIFGDDSESDLYQVHPNGARRNDALRALAEDANP